MIIIKKGLLRTLLRQLVLVIVVLGLIELTTCRAHATDYQGNVEHIHAIEGHPPRAAEWKRTPTVVVCEYAPVSEEQTKKAVKFWKALGHRFFRTQYKYDPANKCNDANPVGYILIHLVTQGIRLDDKNLAETHFFINNDTKEVDWAIIYIRPGLKETVLEHELGHALGWRDYNQTGHIMHSEWSMGGHRTKGLEKK